jgi:hypothetical protein
MKSREVRVGNCESARREEDRKGRMGSRSIDRLALIPLCQDPGGSDRKRIIKKGDFRGIQELNKR